MKARKWPIRAFTVLMWWLRGVRFVLRPALSAKWGYTFVLRDPLVGGVAVGAEHRVRRHHGQQGAGDRRLAGVGDDLKRTVAGPVRGCEQFLLPGPPTAWRRRKGAAAPPVGPPPQTRWRRVVRRVVTVPDPLPRALSALALVRFVGFDDAGKCAVCLWRQGVDDRHAPAPDAVPRRAQLLGSAATGHRLRRLDHVAHKRSHRSHGTTNSTTSNVGCLCAARNSKL